MVPKKWPGKRPQKKIDGSPKSGPRETKSFSCKNVFGGRFGSQKVARKTPPQKNRRVPKKRSARNEKFYVQNGVFPGDHGRPRETTGGHGRSREVTGDHGRPRGTTGLHGRPPGTTRGHGRPRETTGDHGRPPEATGGHGRPRETTGDLGRPRETMRD